MDLCWRPENQLTRRIHFPIFPCDPRKCDSGENFTIKIRLSEWKSSDGHIQNLPVIIHRLQTMDDYAKDGGSGEVWLLCSF